MYLSEYISVWIFLFIKLGNNVSRQLDFLFHSFNLLSFSSPLSLLFTVPLSPILHPLPCCKISSKFSRPKPEAPCTPSDNTAIWDPPLNLGPSSSEGGDAPAQNATGEQEEVSPLEFHPQLKLSGKLKDLKVKVSHVNSPSSFYVQFTHYNPILKRSACEKQKTFK